MIVQQVREKMAITDAQKASAEQKQVLAAKDSARQIRLVAGPGTGKSHSIEVRVAELLTSGAVAANIYVISFTRASRDELAERIQRFCLTSSYAINASQVSISTMHSLALKILRRANLLTSYPSTPIILDNWEQKNIYDKEFSNSLGCTPTRAGEIRLAYEAQWQTLSQTPISVANITTSEINGFKAFHAARTNLYSCVLSGEVIYKCVEAMQQGQLTSAQLPVIDHLIVDEFQDLNKCDQEFIRLLCANLNISLFVAGDDDQSIYSFRHANPDGIINFQNTYPSSSTHVLTDCFRCSTEVVDAANRLIIHNPNRVSKNLTALYTNATPPVRGQVLLWSFLNAQQEADAIAQSCQELINTGMSGREDEIIILISDRRVQLDIIVQALGNLGISYEPPRGGSLTDEYEIIRAVYSILRLIKDKNTAEKDYPAHRDILEVLSGVGASTAKTIGDDCIINNQNFRDMFYLPQCPGWLNGRCSSAINRVMAVINAVANWQMSDTLVLRGADLTSILAAQIISSGNNIAKIFQVWTNFLNSLPQQMTLDEFFKYLSSDNENEQEKILGLVYQRTAQTQTTTPIIPSKKIKILTMHGSKGLSGKIVFIPGLEQGIMPRFNALQATGLLIEQRRLFYMALTRARACCIISHATSHSGAQAAAINQRRITYLSRSQFLNEMQIPSVNKTSGLTAMEATAIISDVNNL
jgi:DNA helicase-2/ATP-dependent DNA helicase PcrA